MLILNHVYFLSSELTAVIMATRGEPTARVDVTQIAFFLDSEYKDCYASVANCLGETSQLEEPHPILGLEKGDFLLTVDNQDIRLESKGAIQKLIEDLFTQDKELLKFSYIKASDFDAERHPYSNKPQAVTHFWGYCTRCDPQDWYKYTQKPDYNFRTHEHAQKLPTQNVSNVKMSYILGSACRNPNIVHI